jgi:hypothetical protein
MKNNLIALLLTSIFIAPVMATSPDDHAVAKSVQAAKPKTKAEVKPAKANATPLKKSIEEPVEPISSTF